MNPRSIFLRRPVTCVSSLLLLSVALRAQSPPPVVAPSVSAPIIKPSSPIPNGNPAPTPLLAPTGSPAPVLPSIQTPGQSGTLTGIPGNVGPAQPSDAVPPTLATPQPEGGNSAVIDDLAVELARRRQAEELSANGNPDRERTYRNQGQVPLRTLFFSLAKQANMKYFEPPDLDNRDVGFTVPVGIRPIDAFYAAARAYGYRVISQPDGFITLAGRGINTPATFSRKIYPLTYLNPFFALQPLAQSLGFQVKGPGQNSPSFPAPTNSEGGGGGGSGGGLGGTTSGDDQSRPRFTPILPLDAPIYFRQHAGNGTGLASAQPSSANNNEDESFLFIDRKQKAFVLFGTEQEHRALREYLTGLDQPEKIIKVHTEIYRVNRSLVDSAGIDWSNTFGGATISLNNSVANASAFQFLPTGLLLNYSNVSVTLRYLVQKGVFRNVATTDLLLRDGIPNTIRQITEDPVVLSTGLTGSTTVNNGGNGGNTGTSGVATGTSEVKTFYYGLSVDGVAFAMPGGKVDLNLNLALSSNQGDKQTSQGPIPRVQRNTTPVSAVVSPGTTCAFGGLVSGNEQISRNAIPYLSRIPFLGKYFFTSTVKNFNGDTLIVFTTPYVLNPDETSANPLTANEQAANRRLQQNIGGFEMDTAEVRRAVPAEGKDYAPFRRGVTRPQRDQILDPDMTR